MKRRRFALYALYLFIAILFACASFAAEDENIALKVDLDTDTAYSQALSVVTDVVFVNTSPSEVGSTGTIGGHASFNETSFAKASVDNDPNSPARKAKMLKMMAEASGKEDAFASVSGLDFKGADEVEFVTSEYRENADGSIIKEIHFPEFTQADMNAAGLSSGSSRIAEPSSYQQGSKIKILSVSMMSDSYYEIPLTCSYVGKHCTIWTEDDRTSLTKLAQICSEFDDNVYSKMDANFGKVYDADGDGKLAIAYYDIRIEGVAGYSNSAELLDGFGGADSPYPMDMIHIDNGYQDEIWKATLPHEMQHSINYSKRVIEKNLYPSDTWINEMLSAAAEYVVNGTYDRLYEYNESDDIANGASLTYWNQQLYNYALVRFFADYLCIHSGDTSIFKKILDNQYPDYRSVEEAWRTYFPESSIEDLFYKYRVALIMNFDEGFYGFKGNSYHKGLVKMTCSLYLPSKMTLQAGGSAVNFSVMPYPFSVPADKDDCIKVFSPVVNTYSAQKIAVGCGTSAAITSDGLYMWGIRIGQYQSYMDVLPKKVDLPNVVSVSLGSNSCAAITQDGSLYTWGDNYFGQLGLGDKTDRPKPQKVNGLPPVVTASLSESLGSCAAITADGDLYTWGDNRLGKLGLGNTTDYSTPQKVDIPPVAKISLGAFTSAALTKDGSLYTWGSRGVGELGHDYIFEDVTKPKKVNLSNVVDMSMGDQITAAVTSDGKLYTWGYNHCGQLGLGSEYTEISYWTPQQVKALSNVIAVSLGGYNCAAVTKDGSLYTWGYNDKAQLGLGNLDVYKTPQKITSLENVKMVQMSNCPCAAVTQDGSLYGWGINCVGTIAKDDKTPQRVYLQGYTEPGVMRYSVTLNKCHLAFSTDQLIPKGTRVYIKPDEPEDNKEFTGWETTPKLNIVYDKEKNCDYFEMPGQNVSITAKFASKSYGVTVTNGYLDGNPGVTSGKYAKGQTVAVTYLENEYGKKFKEWLVTPVTVVLSQRSDCKTTFTFVMPSEAVTLAAVYDESGEPSDNSSLKVTKSNDAAGSAEANDNTVSKIAVLTAKQNNGYYFIGWELNGAIINTASEIILIYKDMGNVTVRAMFVKANTSIIPGVKDKDISGTGDKKTNADIIRSAFFGKTADWSANVKESMDLNSDNVVDTEDEMEIVNDN